MCSALILWLMLGSEFKEREASDRKVFALRQRELARKEEEAKERDISSLAKQRELASFEEELLGRQAQVQVTTLSFPDSH